MIGPAGLMVLWAIVAMPVDSTTIQLLPRVQPREEVASPSDPDSEGIPGLPPTREGAKEKEAEETAQPPRSPTPPKEASKPASRKPDAQGPESQTPVKPKTDARTPEPEKPGFVEIESESSKPHPAGARPAAPDVRAPDGRKPEAEMGEAFCGDEASSRACKNTADAAPCCPKRDERPRWFDGIGCEGWVDQGFTLNTLSPRDRSNGPVGYNDRSNDYQLNQAYIRLKRDVRRDGCTWDVGGRVDLLYGTDADYVSSRGLEVERDLTSKWNADPYGLAMPQCYMEAYCPWGNGTTVKLGHFYSLFGYETVTAPDNFFYSHSYMFQYGEPHTGTGFLTETTRGEFTVRAGMTRGWDNWEDNNNDLGFLGGVNWTSQNQRTNIAMNVEFAREQEDPNPPVRTVYSLVVQQKLGKRWQYVIQYDLGHEPDAGVGGSVASWYGLSQYVFYTINERWKAGFRFEWFRDEGGSRIVESGQTADYYELCPGVNWTPNDRLLVRSELRWDWTGTPDYHPFGDGTRSNQLMLDVDLIVRF